jgi:hypothetical protein
MGGFKTIIFLACLRNAEFTSLGMFFTAFRRNIANNQSF